MKRKKLMPIFLGTAMALSLIGCGDKKTEETKNTETAVSAESIISTDEVDLADDINSTDEVALADDINSTDEVDLADDINPTGEVTFDETEDFSDDFTSQLDYSACKNLVEGRDYNFIFFDSEKTAGKINTMKVSIYDGNNELIESFEFENPTVDDFYCISPVLEVNGELINEYTVEFLINETYCWSRFFISDPTHELGAFRNVIFYYEDSDGTGFNSVLAG